MTLLKALSLHYDNKCFKAVQNAFMLKGTTFHSHSAHPISTTQRTQQYQVGYLVFFVLKESKALNYFG